MAIRWQKKEARTRGSRLLPHMQPRNAQLDTLDTQTPGQKIYSLWPSGNCGSATEVHAGNSHCGRRAMTSLFHGPHVAARPKSRKDILPKRRPSGLRTCPFQWRTPQQCSTSPRLRTDPEQPTIAHDRRHLA